MSVPNPELRVLIILGVPVACLAVGVLAVNYDLQRKTAVLEAEGTKIVEYEGFKKTSLAETQQNPNWDPWQELKDGKYPQELIRRSVLLYFPGHGLGSGMLLQKSKIREDSRFSLGLILTAGHVIPEFNTDIVIDQPQLEESGDSNSLIDNPSSFWGAAKALNTDLGIIAVAFDSDIPLGDTPSNIDFADLTSSVNPQSQYFGLGFRTASSPSGSIVPIRFSGEDYLNQTEVFKRVTTVDGSSGLGLFNQDGFLVRTYTGIDKNTLQSGEYLSIPSQSELNMLQQKAIDDLISKNP